MLRSFITLLLTLILAQASVVWAGSSADVKSVLPAKKVAAFSNHIQQDLAARRANVAIVARVGRNRSQLPNGVNYTHVAYWVYSNITRADGSKGRGYRIYNLYQKSNNQAKSNLIQDSPADFFAGAHSLEAGIIIPDIHLQEKLLRVINSPTYAALHNSKYSVLANPNTSQFQNCTEHTLDVLMASIYNTNDVRQIKANIAAYFKPQTIPLGGLKRLLATFASKAMTTSDHGSTISTATFGSIARFMRKYKLTSQVYKLTPNKAASL